MNGGLLGPVAGKLLFIQLVINQQGKLLVDWLAGSFVRFPTLCLRELSGKKDQKELSKWPVCPMLI